MANIFKRVHDVVNANINELLDRIEDPERMIKQVIREMEDHINQCKEGVVDAVAWRITAASLKNGCKKRNWL